MPESFPEETFGRLAVGQANSQIKIHQIFAQIIELVPKASNQAATSHKMLISQCPQSIARQTLTSGLNIGVTLFFFLYSSAYEETLFPDLVFMCSCRHELPTVSFIFNVFDFTLAWQHDILCSHTSSICPFA